MSLQIDKITNNTIFRSSKLKKILMSHTIPFDKNNKDRHVLLISEFKNGLDPY